MERLKIRDVRSRLEDGMEVRTNGDNGHTTTLIQEGLVELKPSGGFKVVKPSGTYWHVDFSSPGWIEIKGGKGGNMTTKYIWDILVINKDTDEIILREVVIDGDEKSACSKVSIAFAEKLKNLVFDNLAYITRELGTYEKKDKKDK